jgi:hypothetical protein
MAAMKKKMAAPKPKPKPTPTLKGKAAIKELQKQTSKKGVAAMEKKAGAALDKKYGWMK